MRSRHDRFDLAFNQDVFVYFEFDEVARYALNIARALRSRGAFVVSVYTLDDATERHAYRDELMADKALDARRARRMPTSAYEAIWESAGFSVTSRERSASTEYAGVKELTHLNYRLALND